MRRLRTLGLVMAIAVASPAAVFALSQSSIPAKFGLAWGQNAGAPYVRSIPQTSQIGIQNCAASLNDGFPPLTFTPGTAGGCPPFGQDFNGILKQLSQWAQWQSAGGPVFYDSGFASSIGGYPSGSRLASAVTAGTVWMSTVDNNMTNPDVLTGNQIVGGTGWIQDPGQVQIGTPSPSFSSTALPGQALADQTTIGNASSNATGRHNADTQFLFAFLWNNCSNTVCPLKTSGGSPASRGATAAADYAANNAISTPTMQGAGVVGADSGGSAFLNGVPVSAGSTTTTASILGENLHTLSISEIPVITSTGVNTIVVVPQSGFNVPGTQGAISGQRYNNGTGSVGPNFPSSTSGGGGDWGNVGFSGPNTINVSSNNTGDVPVNNVSRAFTVKWNLKL